jgi:ABC-type transport system involved in multi-copper enzyme maturation permease subunit
MLRELVLKEIHDNMVNLRFVLASAACIVLIVVSVAILEAAYRALERDYRVRVVQQDEFIDRYGHMNRAQWLARAMREPEMFQSLVLGLRSDSDDNNFISNPAAALLPRLDFATIVMVIASLVAVLFTYGSVSGEREAGTLRLMLAAGLPRGTFILGKTIGGMVSMLLPFTIGYLAGILYLVAGAGVPLDGPTAAVFGLILAASWLYVSIFTGLGLFCSSTSSTSAQAVLKGLLGWVLLVLVMPNVSPFLAAQLKSVPSAAWVEQATERITSEERDRILEDRATGMRTSRYADLGDLPHLKKSDIEQRIASDPVFRERYASYSREYEEIVRTVNVEQGEKAGRITDEFRKASEAQERLATLLASLSPAGDLTFLLTRIAGTGIEAENHWARMAAEYDNAYWSFVEARYKSEQAAHPAFGSNDHLDLRGRPRFSYHPEGIGERLQAGLPRLCALVFFVVLFPAAALLSIRRYDVR